MSDPLVPSARESNLNALNKRIVEIKKKIQLSEGQRKANYEECDARKKENADKIGRLKKEVKELRVSFARAKNSEDVAERTSRPGNETSAYTPRRGLDEAIARVDEDNVRLRKKLDVVRYESDKQQKKLANSLRAYEELMNGTVQKSVEMKLENPSKKKITSLENQLHRVSVMQMEADTVRKKYRGVRSSLKADAAYYASALRSMEENIKEQENEIKRLQGVKEEAIELRDITKETLMRQEADAMNTGKERDCVILDYRRRVEDRKMELERIERMIFPNSRSHPRDDFDSDGQTYASESAPADGDPKNMAHLADAFSKLQHATGVNKTEEVLDRFLGQQATKDRLQKMRASTEEEKMTLEKRRQQLTAEIELQKFSETKDSDQNAEELVKLNQQIAEQRRRQDKAETTKQRVNERSNEVTVTLWRFCDKLRDVSATPVPEEAPSAEEVFKLLELLNEKVEKTLERIGGPNGYAETLDDPPAEKFDAMSIATASGDGKLIDGDDDDDDDDERPLFPSFPSATTPAVPAPQSDDEDDVPSRNVLKRQAQILVDTKNRRKGFNFRR